MTELGQPQAERQQKNRPEAGMAKSGLVVSSMTFLSRILGLAREVVFATLFGDSPAADAFFVAFKIPNFLRRLFAEGAFSQAFVPVLSEYRKTRSLEEVKNFVDHVAGRLGGALMLVTVLGVIGAPVLASLFGFGYTDEADKFTLLVELLRITFPYILLISLTGFAGGILNSYGYFAVPAMTPVFLNLSLIGCALLLSPLMAEPVMALAWGVILAGLIQLMFQLPFLHHLRLLPRPRLGAAHEGVGKVIKLMIPILFSVSVSQINLLLDTMLATTQVSGSVSWLYYSDRLLELPLGIFGVAIATVILPGLSRIHTAQNADEFSRTLNWGLRCIIVVGIPATVALFLLANPLIYTLFQYGEFEASSVSPTVGSLQAYSLGLMGFMAIKVLASAFFSRQDTRTPVRIGIIAMVVNMVFNLLLIVPLAHVGLALATSLSATVNATLLLFMLYRKNVLFLTREWVGYLLRIFAGAAAMAVVILLILPSIAQWQSWGAIERCWHLAILCVAGGGVYFLALALLGMRVMDFHHRSNV